MRNVTRKFVLAAAGVMMTATVASAQVNLLNVGGQLRVTSTPGATTPLLIDFLSGPTFPPTTIGFGVAGNAFSGTSTGIFAGIAPGTSGQINDITINPVTGIATTTPGGPLLTIGGYTFTFGAAPATGGTVQFGPIALEETSTGVDARITLASTLSGGACGMVGCTYQGLLTAQFAGYTLATLTTAIEGASGSPVVTYSANLSANVVPEPSTYMLLATGIGALGLVARRRRTNV